MAGVRITYETLFDMLRREKGRSELQVLEPSFLNDVILYLKDKNASLADAQRASPMFSNAEKEKIKIQLRNVDKILSELYDVREKKIINLAVQKARTNSNLIDLSSMLDQERQLFEDTTNLLKRTKDNTFRTIKSGELQETYRDKPEPMNSEQSTMSSESEEVEVNESEESDDVDKNKLDEKETEQVNISSSNSKVKFLTNLPKFVGLDKKVYGPFKENDVTDVPKELADLLIKKGRAKVA